MILLENVGVKFNEFNALQNINLQINPKDFILILGHNGAGKTTLFDVISGRVLPTSGRVIRNNKNISRLTEYKRARFISRVFQNTFMGSVAQMTVAENLAMATWKGKRVGFSAGLKSFPEEIVETLLKPLGLRLEELLHIPIGQLSGGQRQIITIIMSTLCHPDLLLLDEPTAALDPASTESLLQFLHKFTANKPMATMMITHDEGRAQFLASRILTLEKGILSTENTR